MNAVRPFSKEELSFTNHDFWWFQLVFSYPYASDHELEMNFDEVMEDSGYAITTRFSARSFEIAITGALKLEIEFLEEEISYYLNGFNIGNISGHSNIAFLTWNELQRLSNNNQVLFLLLLPVTGIEEQEREAILPFIAEHLKEIGIKDEHKAQFANCLVNGLVVADDNFETLSDVGITSNSKHSLRNYNRYEQYQDAQDCQQGLIRLNKLLLPV